MIKNGHYTLFILCRILYIMTYIVIVGKKMVNIVIDVFVHIAQPYCRAVVIPPLLYGSESRTLYQRNIRTLERFLQQKLQTILGVSWEERIINSLILASPVLPVLMITSLSNKNTLTPHILCQIIFCSIDDFSALIPGLIARCQLCFHWTCVTHLCPNNRTSILILTSSSACPLPFRQHA